MSGTCEESRDWAKPKSIIFKELRSSLLAKIIFSIFKS